MLSKVSVDEVFMHYFEKMLSASGALTPLGDFRPSDLLIAHPSKIILRTPMQLTAESSDRLAVFLLRTPCRSHFNDINTSARTASVSNDIEHTDELLTMLNLLTSDSDLSLLQNQPDIRLQQTSG